MSKINRVFAFRHCDDCGETLSKKGVIQAKRVADHLKESLQGKGSVAILSSPLGRAQETARHIAEAVGATIITVEQLVLDYHSHGERQLTAISDHLNEFEYLVIVTHYEAPSGIMNALTRKYFGRDYPSIEIPKGEGFAFNRETGDVDRVMA